MFVDKYRHEYHIDIVQFMKISLQCKYNSTKSLHISVVSSLWYNFLSFDVHCIGREKDSTANESIPNIHFLFLEQAFGKMSTGTR